MLLALLMTIPGASPPLIVAELAHVLLGLEPVAEVQRDDLRKQVKPTIRDIVLYSARLADPDVVPVV